MFTLKASNGQVILTGQGYTDKASALNGINSVRRKARRDNSFQLRTAKNGQPYFVLKASKKEVIGQSVMWAVKAALQGALTFRELCPILRFWSMLNS